LDIDDTLGQFTLVNSRSGGIRNISDTIFFTAPGPLIEDPVENNFVQFDEKTSCSQVLPKLADVHHRNVRYLSSDVYDLEVFC
jgi:hypothetical protein